MHVGLAAPRVRRRPLSSRNVTGCSTGMPRSLRSASRDSPSVSCRDRQGGRAASDGDRSRPGLDQRRSEATRELRRTGENHPGFVMSCGGENASPTATRRPDGAALCRASCECVAVSLRTGNRRTACRRGDPSRAGYRRRAALRFHLALVAVPIEKAHPNVLGALYLFVVARHGQAALVA